MSRMIHMCMDVRGALLNWSDREMEGVFKHNNGRPMSAYEAKTFLMDEIAKGHKVIPCVPCDNFDYQTGCGGHPVEEPAKNATLTERLESVTRERNTLYVEKDQLYRDVEFVQREITQYEKDIPGWRATFDSILGPETLARRVAQDEQWGGPAHDDTHSPEDWIIWISDFTNRAFGSKDPLRYEDKLFDVIALAISAIQSSRRKRA